MVWVLVVCGLIWWVMNLLLVFRLMVLRFRLLVMMGFLGVGVGV